MKHSHFLLALLLLVIPLSACSSLSASKEAEPESFFPVESIFEEFYDFLGGQPRLGAVLSPLIFEGPIQKQYFENAVLLFNPSATLSERYRLAPFGYEIGERDIAIPNPGLPDLLYVEGFIVYKGFRQIYEDMGGQRYVGRPLTGVRYLEVENRVEQYFENLGFTFDLNDSRAEVQLMDYGRQACARDCGSAVQGPTIVQNDLPYGEPFVSMVANLGEDIVGQRIAGPYQSADGSIEVIYENILLFTQADNASQARSRPILALLGISPDPLVPQLDNPNVIFYSIQEPLGYNIPKVFADFIAQHGGYEIFGAPISEVKALEQGRSSQCFENTCLSYLGGGFARVELIAMGSEYKNRFYDQSVAQNVDENLDIQIQVWEDSSQISSSEEQVVHASLFAGSQLLEGLRPYLTLSLPNGGESLFQFPLTDERGHTQLTIPPVTGQNGTLLPYEVCLEAVETGKICASESYMIWGNP
jgi:hypothetical protein